jgi:hypothetical protein
MNKIFFTCLSLALSLSTAAIIHAQPATVLQALSSPSWLESNSSFHQQDLQQKEAAYHRELAQAQEQPLLEYQQTLMELRERATTETEIRLINQELEKSEQLLQSNSPVDWHPSTALYKPEPTKPNKPNPSITSLMLTPAFAQLVEPKPDAGTDAEAPLVTQCQWRIQLLQPGSYVLMLHGKLATGRVSSVKVKAACADQVCEQSISSSTWQLQRLGTITIKQGLQAVPLILEAAAPGIHLRQIIIHKATPSDSR